MVEKYVPNVGDKVRATLGENVILGEVVALSAVALVHVLVSEDEEVCLSGDYWHFEQLVSVPTKFGAVIRRADGMLFQRTSAMHRQHDWLPNDNLFSVDEVEATLGGFTVLFDGVDE